MKTQFLSCVILSFCVLFLSACNPKKAIEEKIAKEMAGAMLGTDVDMSNTDGKNASAKIDLKNGSQSINFNMESSVFQIMKDNKDQVILSGMFGTPDNEKEDTKHVIMFGIMGDASLLKGASIINFGEKEKGKLNATLTLSTTGSKEEMESKGMFGMKQNMVETGTVKIVKFTEEEIIFEFDATAKYLSMKEGESEENALTGTITCKNPLITFIGMKKEEVFR